ncbi:MAG TPA: RNA 2',3'-cyclic phosphodiesterase [Candidatus Limnocylindrales bacterium]|nr:RNA 2',3'-cyclic phosphodiesterase [Candidatus Limnocylindrales bacterium]
MRIFIALDIPAQIRARIHEYRERVKACAPEARWTRVEGLHVTLKFIGEVKEEKLEKIKACLTGIKAGPFEVNFKNAGFFPTPKSPRVFWVGVEAGEELAGLAAAIDRELEKLGIEKESRAFHPHLTLARAGSGPQTLKGLAPLLSLEPAPHFGTMTAREFWLYRSELGRGGAKYTKLEKFALKSS